MDISNLHSFVGPCFGCVIEKVAVYPLDIAKTRIQRFVSSIAMELFHYTKYY